MSSEMGLLELMREDIHGMVLDRNRGRLAYFFTACVKIALYPRIQAVLAFRLAHWCIIHRLGLLAYYLQAWALGRSGAEIHPAAEIGPGFCLVHSSGIVIGDRARIGAHFVCLHGVTLGESGSPLDKNMPVLGDWVFAAAGAKILGGVTIGDYAVIGANAVVLQDVPAGGVAVGIPARIAKVRSVDEIRAERGL